ncbi:MAG: tetratricopeptide repeat protein, partial [Candidatus Poribacteria bacterium]
WMLQRHGGSLDEAATLAERAVGIEPKPRYLDTLSRVYEAQGRADDALHAITRALEADPDNPAYRSRADALRDAGTGGKR